MKQHKEESNRSTASHSLRNKKSADPDQEEWSKEAACHRELSPV
jgi:hypothetical protein